MLFTRRNSHLNAFLCCLGILALLAVVGVTGSRTGRTLTNAQDAPQVHGVASFGSGAKVGSSTSGLFDTIQKVSIRKGVAVPDTGANATNVVYVYPNHVWYAARNFRGTVPLDGSISEWAPHYYVAHSWGPYGPLILGLATGDAVLVNNNLITIQGSVAAAKFTGYDSIMEYVGWDATVFQTCIPGTENCLFVYGRGASSTTAAANEARAFAGLPLFSGTY